MLRSARELPAAPAQDRRLPPRRAPRGAVRTPDRTTNGRNPRSERRLQRQGQRGVRPPGASCVPRYSARDQFTAMSRARRRSSAGASETIAAVLNSDQVASRATAARSSLKNGAGARADTTMPRSSAVAVTAAPTDARAPPTDPGEMSAAARVSSAAMTAFPSSRAPSAWADPASTTGTIKLSQTSGAPAWRSATTLSPLPSRAVVRAAGRHAGNAPTEGRSPAGLADSRCAALGAGLAAPATTARPATTRTRFVTRLTWAAFRATPGWMGRGRSGRWLGGLPLTATARPAGSGSRRVACRRTA